MEPSRAIVVLGMHRSGTSLLTSGLDALGVFLGNDLLEGKPGDNPTGYWEDKTIVVFNDRLLESLGLGWDSGTLISPEQWLKQEIEAIRLEAVDYLRDHFTSHPLWGFKNPRTLRLLPFWRSVFRALGVEVGYVVAIRNPLSVAGSLKRRQDMRPIQSHLLWLVHMVPYLSDLADQKFVVVDYDLMMAEPKRQIERIAQRLNIPTNATTGKAVGQFASEFVDPNLRHNLFARDDFDSIPRVSSLTRDAYLLLLRLATDRIDTTSSRFWSAWDDIRRATEDLLLDFSQTPRVGMETPAPMAKLSRFRKTDVHFFAVLGYQRTGSILLRELLNSHPQVVAFTEVFLPSPAPSFRIGGKLVAGGVYPYDNFLRDVPSPGICLVSPRESESLLDQYFEYLHHHVRNHPADSSKGTCSLIGLNIKYSQLKENVPPLWDANGLPFLLSYLGSRGVTLIHTTRKNVIHCALSGIIAEQRNLWHNYEGAVIDRTYHVDVEECLASARRYVRDCEMFLRFSRPMRVIECVYEDLCGEVARAGAGGQIPDEPGPMRDIADALEIPFHFRYDGRLRKAVDVPYSRLIANRDELVKALRASEFASFAASLETE